MRSLPKNGMLLDGAYLKICSPTAYLSRSILLYMLHMDRFKYCTRKQFWAWKLLELRLLPPSVQDQVAATTWVADGIADRRQPWPFVRRERLSPRSGAAVARSAFDGALFLHRLCQFRGLTALDRARLGGVGGLHDDRCWGALGHLALS